jgi:diguanylate cyclase (GGDEF)-like protein
MPQNCVLPEIAGIGLISAFYNKLTYNYFIGGRGNYMLQENSVLSTSITSMLRSSNNDDWELIEGINSLASIHGNVVYDEFFYALTQMRFGADLAFSHWNNVISHVGSVITSQYMHQGLLPAVLHYMQKETGVIHDPRFFESDFIDTIKRSSITDGLTGLYNQTFFKNSLSKLICQSRRHAGQPFSIVLFDLDYFKQYNDSVGHLAGDHALKNTAKIINKSLRESDIAARYGGEEFALLLPQTTKEMAQRVANRIRHAIEKAPFQGQELIPAGNLTISGGVAEFTNGTDDDIESLIEAADRELYKAKIRRNSVCPNKSDRRRGIRWTVRSLVECSVNGKSDYWPAISMNISEVGMALGCDVGLPVGSPVKLKFKKPYWTYNVDLNAIVRQNKKVGELSFVGMEFEGGFSGDLSSFRSDLDFNSSSSR